LLPAFFALSPKTAYRSKMQMNRECPNVKCPNDKCPNVKCPTDIRSDFLSTLIRKFD